MWSRSGSGSEDGEAGLDMTGGENDVEEEGEEEEVEEEEEEEGSAVAWSVGEPAGGSAVAQPVRVNVTAPSTAPALRHKVTRPRPLGGGDVTLRWGDGVASWEDGVERGRGMVTPSAGARASPHGRRPWSSPVWRGHGWAARSG
ncbi:hypothetical protein GCM10025784_25770 [Citricoccus nitrophenolicus]